jgi:hypothetical protein
VRPGRRIVRGSIVDEGSSHPLNGAPGPSDYLKTTTRHRLRTPSASISA